MIVVYSESPARTCRESLPPSHAFAFQYPTTGATLNIPTTITIAISIANSLLEPPIGGRINFPIVK